MGEYQHTHEVPHECVIFPQIRAGFSGALVRIGNSVDLHIHTTVKDINAAVSK